MIGGTLAELKSELDLVKQFRKKLTWDLGLAGGEDVWEHHHQEHMNRWNEFNEKEAWGGEGTIMFDRN